ncbi:amino acid ABC transporter membrane protein 2 (PAAT family) [Maritalea mobilis]|uniref:Amino acid ABC transporter membrane protein 2 (PAAT family) n=1 Tax=Maritalea mobilis TaxID=483324 RepID=A0A4R6VU82_9HYPH|nr:amino acid ABC transporter permease [Maritalea mobilis]TDQ63761.1 amino acid ABC transporter membrane protein 2 (PAAT family) [Maritalea mobilis]
MNDSIAFFSGFGPKDLWFLTQAAWQTLLISVLSISGGTILGIFFGWILSESKVVGAITVGFILDAFRSVPLIIQLVLFYNLFNVIGLAVSPFWAGVTILGVYTSALVANVARGGIEAVGAPMRRAGRSLGMSYLQTMRYVVWPIGLRAVFPSWVGVALGVLKDSALVSVLGHPELLKVARDLITRTQQPLLVLAVAGAFYFALSFPISRYAAHLERKWQS